MSTRSRFPLAVYILAAGVICCATGPASADVWYVDIDNASGLEDGTSWPTACRSIQQAVNYAAADGGGEVWVAEGTYTATTDPVLTMARYVHIYGGFAGLETARDQRDWSTHVTTIDGQDTRRSVRGASYATLDGFIVTRGYTTRGGGGMYNYEASPRVTNCTFSENSGGGGGGMYNTFSIPTVTNCTFSGNSASSGGGMYSYASSVTVTNCTFAGNSASSGGGMYDYSTWSATVMNCIFSGNSADSGAGIYNYSSSPAVTNCTFSENSAGSGGGMYNYSYCYDDYYGDEYCRYSSPTVTNCIFWSDLGGEISSSSLSSPTVSYSCIQGGHSGDGNINTDPLFWNSLAGDLRLHASSPCLDSATTNLVPDADIRGVSRPQGAGIDMGAYEMNEVDSDGDGLMDDFEIEYSNTDPNDADSDGDGTSDGEAWFAFRVWYVNTASPASEPDGGSWDTAFADIQSAVDSASIRAGGEIWVVQGSYNGTGDNIVVMRYNVHLYGGFVGTETARAQRDWETHLTTIDGEGARRCVYGADSATLDGFAVTRGNAGSGGGMYNWTSSPMIANCSFVANSANSGGGIFNCRSASPMITNCTFSGNSAMDNYGGGGAMYNAYSSPAVTNCVFLENSAEGNYGRGGGMYNSYSSSVLTNCTFSGNSAEYGGGGMHNSYSSPSVVNCILWGDPAGEIDNTPSSSPTVAYSCIQGGYDGDGNIDTDPLFWNTLAGDLWLHASSPCLDSGTANSAPDADIRGVPRPHGAGIDMGAYEMDEVDSDGDGLMNGFETEYSNTLPDNPDSDGDGTGDGEAWFAFRVWYVNAASPTAQPDGASWDTAFADIQSAIDSAFIRGGGEIWVAQGSYTGRGENAVTMRYNVDLYAGFASTETVRDQRDWAAHVTTIDGEDTRRCIRGADDTTLDGFTITRGYARQGAGMYNDHASPTLTNCTFTDNSAAYGGGMYNLSSSPAVMNCTFSGNSATSSGGGMCNCYGLPTVTNCTFAGNSVTYNGGGMDNACSSPVVMNCTFAGNSAVREGGGMYSYSSPSATVTNCTFSENLASAGGGMYNYRSLTPVVTNCTFLENSAHGDGGGMHNFYDSSPTIMNCIFSGNSVDGDGGGMYNNYAAPTVTKCIFSGNSVDGDGGGIHNHLNSSPTVTSCTFAGNSASNEGGGMYNYYRSSPTVTNCTFSENSASNEGGGMYNYQLSSPTVTNCSFSGNSADCGGGMHNYQSSSPTVRNCILWGDSGGEIYSASSSSPTVAYSCIQGGYSGTGNIDDNPLFVDAAGGNLRLESASPCIDTGTAEGAPETDIEGVPRPQGAGFDMGAYEYVPGTEGEGEGEGEEGEGEGQSEGEEEGELPSAIVILVSPVGASVYEGMSYRFSVVATGGRALLHFEWKKGNIGLGAPDSPVLALDNLTLADAGTYRCTVSDGLEAVNSAPATLSVFAAATEGFHSADTTRDRSISLSELLRVIQFYNHEELSCAEGTEDGYAPGSGAHDCLRHDSDYQLPEWSIGLSELLRLIQFYNTPGGAYHPEQGTEDGFAPGAE